MNKIIKIIKSLPTKPGVYYFYNKYGRIIYVGKAAVLKNRVKSYFVGAHDNKTEALISQISNIKYKTTDSVLEALILEANEIKRYNPKYNIREKDDKSFAYIYLSKDEFPIFFVARASQLENIKISRRFGPYLSANSAIVAIKILRKIFGFRDCNQRKFKSYQKRNYACMFGAIGLCLAPCNGKISKSEYAGIIHEIVAILSGKKKFLVTRLKRQMDYAADRKRYELAARLRDKLHALEHINDIAIIKNERALEQIKFIPKRIEAYDISNLGQTNQVGAMVVFSRGEIDKKEYRRFKINYKYTNHTNHTNHTNKGIGDPQMMAEIIERRFNHAEWPKPDLMLLDGGKGQLSAVLKILKQKSLKIPVIAVAKGPTRKGYKLFKNSLAEKIIIDKKFIQSIRDEAHRFAISYHRLLKGKSFLDRSEKTC